jgi:hypothetical protein
MDTDKNENVDPKVRRLPPKLPEGGVFVATDRVVKGEDGKWMRQRFQRINPSRRAAKELGLTGRQLKKLRRAANRAARTATLDNPAK